eukprot:3282687-Alexandrium_andersonii.AAC.1
MGPGATGAAPSRRPLPTSRPQRLRLVAAGFRRARALTAARPLLSARGRLSPRLTARGPPR